MVNKSKEHFWDKYGNTLFYALLTLSGALAMLTVNFQMKGVETNRIAIKESTVRDNAIHQEMIENIEQSTRVQVVLVQQVKEMSGDIKDIKECQQDNTEDIWRLKAKVGIIQ